MKNYPSRNGNWAWKELETLAMALGFHGKLFYDAVSSEKKKEPFLKSKEIELLLDGTILYPFVHKTFNHNDGSYNIKVISKSIELLTNRHLSFSSLRVARVSFASYEHTDNAGLEDSLVLRAMKLCDKTMAPLKVKQMLRHMDRLISDRLMFYEFLELLASAEELSNVSKEIPAKKTTNESVDDRKLYDLCDFEDELLTYDDRCYRYLDKKYEESLKIIPVQSSNKTVKEAVNVSGSQEWVTPPLANTSCRKEMVAKNHIQSKHLEKYLDSSNTMVKQCQCGGSCVCLSNMVSIVQEMTKIQTAEASTQEVIPLNSLKLEHKKMDDIVTKKDQIETARNIQNVQWQIATQSNKRKKRFENKNVHRSSNIQN